MTTSSTIVQRLWNYCNVLRDDGMAYGDYVEQLTYLLFLKMDASRACPDGAAPSRWSTAGTACSAATAPSWSGTTSPCSTR